MRIKLAPISILMPAAIEKNAVAEEMSRMGGRGLEAHYSISRTLQGKRNSPLQGWLDLKDFKRYSLKPVQLTDNLLTFNPSIDNCSSYFRG